MALTTTALPTCLNSLLTVDLALLVLVCEDLTLPATAEAWLAMAVSHARPPPLEETMASLATNLRYIIALRPTVYADRLKLAIVRAHLPICNIFIYRIDGSSDPAHRRQQDRIMLDSDKDLVPWSTRQYPPRDLDPGRVPRSGSDRSQRHPNRDTRRKAQHCQRPLPASFPPTEQRYTVLLVISSKMDAFRRLLLPAP